MAELDPPRLPDIMASSAWWPQPTSDQRQRLLLEVEEARDLAGRRRYGG